MFKTLFKVVILAGSLGGNVAFSYPSIVFEGQDAMTNRECTLFITDVSDMGPEQTDEQWYGVVHTSYQHNGDSAAPFTVTPHPTKPGILWGTGANGKDQIVIALDPEDLNLENATSFSLKWLHGNHFHTNRCINLQIHQD